jgi:hypothetical protein
VAAAVTSWRAPSSKVASAVNLACAPGSRLRAPLLSASEIGRGASGCRARMSTVASAVRPPKETRKVACPSARAFTEPGRSTRRRRASRDCQAAERVTSSALPSS